MYCVVAIRVIFPNPTIFLKKVMGMLQSPPSVRPSVCPSCFLLHNHWTKSNQIWCVCVCVAHMNGVCNGTFFGPAPWGHGEGTKGQILLNIIKFQLQSQFQRFFTKLFVSTHK